MGDREIYLEMWKRGVSGGIFVTEWVDHFGFNIGEWK